MFNRFCWVMVLAVAVCVVGCAEEAANTRVSAVPLDNSQYSNVFVRVHPDSDEDSVVERVVSGQVLIATPRHPRIRIRARSADLTQFSVVRVMRLGVG
jgi:hypothetical protein